MYVATMRLDRFFSSQEILSRKEVKEAVRKKEITVNGQIANKIEMQIDPQTAQVCYKGQAVLYEPFIYLMMNKPQGVVCATEDKIHKTVLDLVPKELFRSDLFPAGRLDKDTVGFVLLTNDGDFAHRILSPKSHVSKRYEVRIDGRITAQEEELLRHGITLADGYVCKPCTLTLIDDCESPVYEIILIEGKYHQIKRMFGSVGRGVLFLKRTHIGGVELDKNLPECRCRKMMHKEIDQILCK